MPTCDKMGKDDRAHSDGGVWMAMTLMRVCFEVKERSLCEGTSVRGSKDLFGEAELLPKLGGFELESFLGSLSPVESAKIALATLLGIVLPKAVSAL